MADDRIYAVKVTSINRSCSFRSFNVLVECKKIMAAVLYYYMAFKLAVTQNELVVGARNIKFCVII